MSAPGKTRMWGVKRKGLWALTYPTDRRLGVKWSRDDIGWLLSGGIFGRAVGVGWAYL